MRWNTFARYSHCSLVALLFAGCGGQLPTDGQMHASGNSRLLSSSSGVSMLNYDQAVLADRPVLYLAMRSPQLGSEYDLTGNGNNGTYRSTDGAKPFAVTMPNGDTASRFNGLDQFLEVADADALSVPTTGVLTLEAWMRPDVLEFPKNEGSGYVHWMGKGQGTGVTGQQEYVARMYSLSNTEERQNRISGYAFNPEGGKGSGSYFQEPVTPGEWIHYALVINTRATSAKYPTGYVRIYKNGVLKDTTALNQFDVVPRNGTAPFQVGTRAAKSFFLGAIGKVAMYSYELTREQLGAHYNAMCAIGCPSSS